MNKDINKIIDSLNQGNLKAVCPNCDKEFKLNEVGLFHLEDFTTEAKLAYTVMIQAQKERRKLLKELKLKIPIKSEVGAKAVNLGFIFERIAPTLNGFTFAKNDCRPMFDPIDYVIFEGLSKKNKVDKIIFVDIKTGGARLTTKQRIIKKKVEERKVEFKTYMR